MKILAATSDYSGYLEELDGMLYNVGYSLSIINGRNGIPELVTKPKEELMPDLIINTHQEGNVIYFSTELSFPNIDSSKLDFSSTTKYYLDKWAKLGKVITHINELEFSIL